MTRKKIICLDYTSPEDMEDYVCDKKDNIENNDKKKELECIDDTSPDDT